MKSEVCGNCAASFDVSAAKTVTLGENTVVFCPSCGVGRTSVSQSQLARRAIVNEQFYNVLNRINSYFGRRIEFFRRYTQSLALARRHGKQDSCLDIGCSIGYWLYFLKTQGFSRTAGVELNASCAKFGREVLGVEIAGKLADCSGHFDLITLFDVLEHLEAPGDFLSSLSPLAHKDTLYFIQLPNYKSRMALRLGKAWPWWQVPDHLWHFTPAAITRLLNRAGFEVVELETCDVVYDLVEYVAPSWTRSFLRLLACSYRTSGYVYRRAGRGGLIQVLAKAR